MTTPNEHTAPVETIADDLGKVKDWRILEASPISGIPESMRLKFKTKYQQQQTPHHLVGEDKDGGRYGF